MRRCGDAGVEKVHTFKAQALRQRLRSRDQLAAGFDTVNVSPLQRPHVQVIHDKPEVGLAGAVVHHCRAIRGRGQLLQDFFDESKQVVDLLEFAPGILVQLALAGQDMQFLQQGNGLPGAQKLLQGGIGFFSGAGFHASGPHSKACQPKGPSALRVAMLRP